MCRHRSGLTLAELLIVFIVVACVFFLLVTYLLHERESARRARCEANQAGLAKACLAFNAARGHFPGYLNEVGRDARGTAVDGSWLVAILPFHEQKGIFQQWEKGVRTAPRFAWLICPDGAFPGAKPDDPVLSYSRSAPPGEG